MTNTGSTLSKI